MKNPNGWNGPPGSRGRPVGLRNGQGKPPITLTRLNGRHLTLLEAHMANPKATREELGKIVGWSLAYVSMVMRSDVFKAAVAERWAERKAVVEQTVMDEIFGVAEKGLGEINRRLDDEVLRTIMPDKEVRAHTSMALDAMGLLRSAPTVVATQNNTTFNVSKEELQLARQRAADPAYVLDGTPDDGGLAEFTAATEGVQTSDGDSLGDVQPESPVPALVDSTSTN